MHKAQNYPLILVHFIIKLVSIIYLFFFSSFDKLKETNLVGLQNNISFSFGEEQIEITEINVSVSSFLIYGIGALYKGFSF